MKNKKLKILVIISIIFIVVISTFKLKFYEDSTATACTILINKPTKLVYFHVHDKCSNGCKSFSDKYYKKLQKTNYLKLKKGFEDGFNEPCEEILEILNK